MSENYKVQPPDILFRWLHPGQFVWAENRASSGGFSGDYLSVDIATLTTLDESYRRAEKNGKNAIVSFEAQIAFDKNQNVCHCPAQSCKKTGENVCSEDTGCPEYKDDADVRELNSINPAHGCVVGKKTGSVKNHFMKNCKVEIFPPSPESITD